MMKAAHFGLHWLLLSALYFLLAGQFGATEVMAGLPSAAAAAIFIMGLQLVPHRKLRLAAPWPHLAGKTLVSLFRDTVLVGIALARVAARGCGASAGLAIRQGFREGDDRPEDAGRRGLVTLAVSLAPNGFVMDIPAGENNLLLHRLVPVDAAPGGDWPS